MNLFIIIAVVLGGGTMAADRLIYKIPSRLAVVLYGIAAILLIIGMIVRRKAGV